MSTPTEETPSTGQVAALSEYYAYSDNIKEAQSFVQNLSSSGHLIEDNNDYQLSYLALQSLSVSPQGRDLISKVAEPFTLTNGSTCAPKLKFVKNNSNINADNLSYVDYTNPNEPVINISSSLLSLFSRDDAKTAARKNTELFKSLVYGLHEIKIYKECNGDVANDPLQQLELIKGFNDVDKKTELLTTLWELQQVANNNPRVVSGKDDKNTFFDNVKQSDYLGDDVKRMANAFDKAISESTAEDSTSISSIDKLQRDWDKSLLASIDNNASYYAFTSNEENTTSDNAKSASETITEARYKAALGCYNNDAYISKLQGMYSSITSADKALLKQVIANEPATDGKEYLLALSIPTLKNDISGPWLRKAIDKEYKFYAKYNMGVNGGETYTGRKEIRMAKPDNHWYWKDEPNDKMYAHLLDFSHELRHSYQGNTGMEVKGTGIKEKLLMNNCLEGDANAMSILAMYRYKTNNNWSEPYNYLITDATGYNKSMFEAFDSGIKDGNMSQTDAAYAVFESWFNLIKDKGASVDLPYLPPQVIFEQITLKDYYNTNWANRLEIATVEEKDRVKDVNYIIDFMGKDTFDINTSESFATFIEKFRLTEKSDKYLPNDVITNLLSKDEIINTNQKTIDILVKKIRDYFGVDKNGISDDENEERKLKAKPEIEKLPSVYKNFQDKQKQQINNNEENNIQFNYIDTPDKLNKTKAKHSLLERHNTAKERIAFYQNNKKAKEIKIAIARKMTKGRS